MKKEFSPKEKKSYIFLLDLMASLFNPQHKISLPPNIDFDNLYSISASSHIANMVSYALESQNFPVEKDTMARFVRTRKFFLMKDASQFVASQKLVRKFEEKGIDNLLVKGQYIKEKYPQPDYRTMSDVDIHIKKSDLPKIKDILLDMNYKIVVEGEDCITCRQEPFVLVEIHGDNGEFRNTIFGDNLFNSAKLVDGTSYTYRFDDTFHYIYIVEHFAKHYRDVGGMGIRMVMDMYVLYNNLIKGGKVQISDVDKYFKKSGLTEFHKMLVNKGKKYFETKVTDFDIVDIFILSNYIFGTKEIKIYNNRRKYIKDYMDNSNKEKYILNRAFPPLKRMKEEYPVLNKNKALLPFVWVHRNVKILTSKDRKKYVENITNYKKYSNKEEIFYLDEIMKQSGFNLD